MNKKDVRSEYIHKMALLVSKVYLNKKESLQTQDTSSDDI
jgi:hypothetical protein